MLIERALAAVGFIALVDGADVVSSDLNSCPAHSLALLGRAHIGMGR